LFLIIFALWWRKVSLRDVQNVVAIGETSKTACEKVSPFAKWLKQLARRFRQWRNDQNRLREGFAVREMTKTV
jgi:hypothetical protein